MMIGTMVMLALTMAINLQLKYTDVGRTDVEEAQLARAILRQVADDLRSSVFPTAIEVEGAAEAFKAAAEAAKKVTAAAAASGEDAGASGSGSGQGESQGGQSSGGGAAGGQFGAATGGQTGGAATGAQTGGASTLGGGAAGGLTGGAGGSSLGGATGAGTTGEEGTSTDGSTATTTLVTGLYGTPYSLQFDIARVPRSDEWTAMPAGAAAGLAAVTTPGLDRTSEVKTVSYMLLTDSPLAGGASVTSTGLAQPTTGLVRTEMDRATAAYAQTGATLSLSTGKQELLAPEVNSLAFRYFDGTSWYTQWDSTTQQGLPTAVEIQLGVASSQTRSGQPAAAPAATVAGAAPVENTLLYRLVVQIPGARGSSITQLELQDEEAEAAAAESASGGLGTGTGTGVSGSTLGSGT